MVPLVAFSQTDDKSSTYPDNCEALFKKSDQLYQSLETNEFTKNLFTEAQKNNFKTGLDGFKKELSSISQDKQVRSCDYMLEKFERYIQAFNNIKSEDDALKAFPILKKITN